MNYEQELKDLYQELKRYKKERDGIEDMIEQLYFKIDEVKDDIEKTTPIAV